MRIPFFQIDAFADATFGGNQAAVMPLAAFLPDAVLQSIAAENNLAETAFIVNRGGGAWDLRWFTPTTEVPICGHATLAAGHAILAEGGYAGPEVTFHTASGPLKVARAVEQAGVSRYQMQLPKHGARRIETPPGLAAALGVEPVETWLSHFVIAVLDSPNRVRGLTPDFAALARIGAGPGPDVPTSGPGNVSVVAEGAGFGPDLVVRMFAPGVGVDEDPATGSAYCGIAPLFAERLMKSDLSCFQAFPGRGASIHARYVGDDVVTLSGGAVTVISGEFRLGA